VFIALPTSCQEKQQLRIEPHRMTTTKKYPSQQARCLYFDANGKKVSQPSQEIATAFNPWRDVQELLNHPDKTR